MRFVEMHRPLAAAAVTLVMAMAGCASLPDPIALVKQVVTPSSDEAKSDASTPAERAAAADKARAGAAPMVIAAEPETPVDPRAQAAFDTARRAMRNGRSDDAERQLKALAQSNPELGGVQANLGLIYRQAGKLPE